METDQTEKDQMEKEDLLENNIPESNFEIKIPYRNNGFPKEATKTKLFHSDKIEVRKSTLQGYGIFAKENIDSGEILEECHYVEVEYGKEVDRFKFNWPKGEDYKKYVLSLGYGSIYNTAIPVDKKNTDWETDLDNDILVFHTIKDVKKDSELLVDYHYNS